MYLGLQILYLMALAMLQKDVDVITTGRAGRAALLAAGIMLFCGARLCRWRIAGNCARETKHGPRRVLVSRLVITGNQ
jgi:hypothetical protein